MVDGRPARKLLIVDLDGTVLSVNSFHRWYLFLACARFPHLAPAARAEVAWASVMALVWRKLGRIDHARFKWRMQRLWQRAVRDDAGVSVRCLVDDLLRYVRPEMKETLAAIAAGDVDAVLATAAAGDYAYALGQALGFTHVLATPAMRGQHDPENIGEAKRNAVLSFLAAQGWEDRPRILVTDHRDDLPLIRVCDAVHWFGEKSERAVVARAAPGVRIHERFAVS
jgi:phosphoserine phosphatase